MTSREEAESLAEAFEIHNGLTTVNKCKLVIKAIYDSFGTCGECKHLKQSGVCKLHSVDAEANVIMMNNDFCSYFERFTDDKHE